MKNTFWTLRLTSILFIIGTVWWSYFIISPPSPKPVDAPDDQFSAIRASKHVESIARSPHPVGTEAHDQAFNYVRNELEKLGLDPVVQQGTEINRGRMISSRVKNLFAKMEGTDSRRTILLMAHYDSVPYAPGAADDASGAATLLEGLRALKASSPLKNDVWILITDGEEVGLMGAKYFMKKFEDHKQIDLMLNFEARGSSGASIMFETGSGNAGIIPHFAKAAPYPFANSITYTIYRLLPNNSDFTVLKREGIQGLNFAFIEDYLNYHTMQDNPENLSLHSLQHDGENLLANVRHFGNIDFNIESSSDLVYFNNPFYGLTYYPESWSLWIGILTVLLFIFLIYKLYRERSIHLGYMAGGLGIYLAVIAVTILITFFGWQLLEWIHPEYSWNFQGETYQLGWYFWAFMSMTLLIFTPAFHWLQEMINIHNLLGGVYLLWVLLGLFASIYLPGMSYLLTWPALFGIFGWMVVRNNLDDPAQLRTLILLYASLFLALFLIAPFVKLIQISLTTRMLAVSMFLVLLIAGITWPLIRFITVSYKRGWVGLFGFVFMACMVIAGIRTGFDEDHSKQNSLVYAADLDQGDSYWISTDHKPDRWTTEFLGSDPAHSPLEQFGLYGNTLLLHNSAPAIDAPEVELDIQSDSTADSLRYLEIQFRTSGRAFRTQLSFNDPSNLVSLSIDGKKAYNRRDPLPGQREWFSKLYHTADLNRPFSISITVIDGEDLSLQTEWMSLEYPDSLMQQYPERPPEMMPQALGFSNGMLWKKTFALDDQ